MGHRAATPEKDRQECGRCGKCANPTDGWEHDWPLYGRIELGFPSQAFAALCGVDIAAREHFEWWNEGHPAMVKNTAQHVAFEWGNGYRFNSVDRYRLCYGCQRELLKTVGRFFGIPEQAMAKREKKS